MVKEKKKLFKKNTYEIKIINLAFARHPNEVTYHHKTSDEIK